MSSRRKKRDEEEETLLPPENSDRHVRFLWRFLKIVWIPIAIVSAVGSAEVYAETRERTCLPTTTFMVGAKSIVHVAHDGFMQLKSIKHLKKVTDFDAVLAAAGDGGASEDVAPRGSQMPDSMIELPAPQSCVIRKGKGYCEN